MRPELDRILDAHGVGTLVVSLHESAEPSFRWLSRGAAVTRGHIVLQRGEQPLLVHYPMERDEATATGVATISAPEMGYPEIFSANPPVRAWAAFFTRIFETLHVQEPVMFAGNQPLHIYVPLLHELEREGRFRLATGDGTDLLQKLRRPKSESEIAQIEDVGRRTEEVVGEVRELLRAVAIEGGVVRSGGERLTIGRIKDIVSAGIVRRGMVEDHETIVSHGRDAGVPHSRGRREDELREGVPLVIDIFPRDARSGWFFDLTRTFCVGEIPARLERVHAMVLEAHSAAVEAAREGVSCASLQRATCEYFQRQGFPTVMDAPGSDRGYVHGLGHGVGLEVHELPSFGLSARNEDRLERGDVFTIEPGLYDPDQEIGVRIEDTLCIGADGVTRSLSHSDRGLRP